MNTLGLFVAGDAGAGAALAPVAAALGKRDGWSIRAVAHRFAQSALARCGHSIERLPAETDDLFIPRPDVVIAGSSWREASELNVVKRAHALGLPTLVVLDFWSHYRERFTHVTGDFIVPDRIAVIDEAAKVGLLQAGVPETAIRVTGAPHFDDLTARAAAARISASALRRQLGLDAGDLFVLFVSQPIAATVGRRFGYTEDEVLRLLVDSVEYVASCRGRSITVGVRRHAREEASTPISSASVRILNVEGGESLEWACSADLVVGMNSALLLEAALAGAIVISVQPGVDSADDLLPSNASGLTTAVYEVADLVSLLEMALTDAVWRQRRLQSLRGRTLPGGAAERVVRIIESLVSDTRGALTCRSLQ